MSLYLALEVTMQPLFDFPENQPVASNVEDENVDDESEEDESVDDESEEPVEAVVPPIPKKIMPTMTEMDEFSWEHVIEQKYPSFSRENITFYQSKKIPMLIDKFLERAFRNAEIPVQKKGFNGMIPLWFFKEFTAWFKQVEKFGFTRDVAHIDFSPESKTNLERPPVAHRLKSGRFKSSS